MNATLTTALERCKRLPSLPAVVTEIVRQCSADDFEVSALSALIAKDPALSLKLLQTANSSLYSFGRESKTIGQAIMRLGSNTVAALALSFSLVGTRGPKSGVDLDFFWRRALLCAVAARALAKELGLDGEELFLSGLLQDLGVLAMASALDDYAAVLEQGAGDHLRLERLERETYGAGHPDVGAWLCDRWGLPPMIGLTVASSHLPVSSSPDTSRAFGCVALSGWIAEIWTGGRPEDTACTAAELAVTWLSLAGAPFERVLTAVGQALPELEKLFAVKLEDPDLAAEVLAQAREALVRVSLRASETARQSETLASELAAQKRDLEQRMSRDALTGLFTRSYLDVALTLAFENANRFDRSLSVLFCDIDHFKTVNDRHGHSTGDLVLRAVAGVLAASVRQLDSAARYGGEEFIAVLPATDEAGALVVAERIRRNVESTVVRLADGGELHVTISVGVAVHGPSARTLTVQALINQADGALYQAKAGGRNRVARHH